MRKLIVLAAAAFALAACHPKPATPDMGVESKAFMAKVAKEEGVRLLPSGVAYKIVRSGPASGLRPGPNDEVKVNYEGKLINGRVFDSSYERGQPAAMPLNRLVPAWQEALQLMRPGDEWILYVPSDKGYGPEGMPPEIPPNAALIFRIELIDFLPAEGRIQQG